MAVGAQGSIGCVMQVVCQMSAGDFGVLEGHSY